MRSLGFLIGVLMIAASLVGSPAHAQSATPRAPYLAWKRAAAVELSLAAVFAGGGAALVATQPSHSFAWGAGLGHLAWSASLMIAGIDSAVIAARARQRGLPAYPSGSVRNWRWDVAASAVSTLFGGALLSAALVKSEGLEMPAGLGAVLLGYGAGDLAHSIWGLVQAKRRARQCVSATSVR